MVDLFNELQKMYDFNYYYELEKCLQKVKTKREWREATLLRSAVHNYEHILRDTRGKGQKKKE